MSKPSEAAKKGARKLDYRQNPATFERTCEVIDQAADEKYAELVRLISDNRIVDFVDYKGHRMKEHQQVIEAELKRLQGD